MLIEQQLLHPQSEVLPQVFFIFYGHNYTNSTNSIHSASHYGMSGVCVCSVRAHMVALLLLLIEKQSLVDAEQVQSFEMRGNKVFQAV